MKCPICRKKGVNEKGYYSGGIENHISPNDYYKEDFYYCDLGHEWGMAQEPNKRNKTIIIKDDWLMDYEQLSEMLDSDDPQERNEAELYILGKYLYFEGD